MLEVPNGRLFVATILHGSTIALGALVVFGLLGAGVRSVGPLALAGIPALLPVAIGIACSRVKELLTHGNFHLADAGTGVRVQEGLTDLRTTTIPLHRIQALELVQPLWWRPVGWWRIRVNVAGSGGQGEGEGHRETTLLPVGTLADARQVLALVAPGVPAAAWDSAVLGDGGDPALARADRRGALARPPVVAAQRLVRRRLRRAAAQRPAHPSGDRGAARPHPVAHRCARAGSRPGSAWRRRTSCRRPARSRPCWRTSTSRRPRRSWPRCPNAPASARRRSEPPRAPLAPDPSGLVDWSRHPQGTLRTRKAVRP